MQKGILAMPEVTFSPAGPDVRLSRRGAAVAQIAISHASQLCAPEYIDAARSGGPPSKDHFDLRRGQPFQSGSNLLGVWGTHRAPFSSRLGPTADGAARLTSSFESASVTSEAEAVAVSASPKSRVSEPKEQAVLSWVCESAEESRPGSSRPRSIWRAVGPRNRVRPGPSTGRPERGVANLRSVVADRQPGFLDDTRDRRLLGRRDAAVVLVVNGHTGGICVFLKRSERRQAKLSLVLLDWSVRESFHLISYLEKQTVARDLFEVIIIEYYSKISKALQPHEKQIDTWLLLEMPESSYYHKHLMYNAGIALANGEIIAIGDSDAMVRETFVEAILSQFESDPACVLHIDQFRNTRQDLYPFCYPSFEEVLGKGCINNMGGKTTGVVSREDPIHTRNYGSCMCARREDLIAIGGADMHVDYLGHICGPYDMTFRLTNLGLRELWSQNEFMYHTWHPGQAGADNYLGPHDGRHMSTTSLESLRSGRIRPLVEHPAIAMLRQRRGHSDPAVIEALVDPEWAPQWTVQRMHEATRLPEEHPGFWSPIEDTGWCSTAGRSKRSTVPREPLTSARS